MRNRVLYAFVLFGMVSGLAIVGALLASSQHVGAVSDAGSPASNLPAIQPGDYSVVFLGAEGAASANGLVTAERLSQSFGAVTVSNWDQVVSISQAEVIDALIVHRSALEKVDREWVARNYRQGVTIAGIDLNGAEMAELLRDACLTRDGFADYHSGSYFVIATSQISGSADDMARIMEAYEGGCGERGAEGVIGMADYSARYTTEFLTDERSYEIFSYLLNDHMESQ